MTVDTGELALQTVDMAKIPVLFVNQVGMMYTFDVERL